MDTDDLALQRRIEAEVTKLYPQARTEAWRAYQRAPHALEQAELESLALFGLAQAARRWPVYCAGKGYSPWAFNFFAAYSLRRMRGAMLDAMRASDWVTRSERTRAKAIRDASQERPLTEEELAGVTGLSLEEVRETLAVVAARPVSMDAEPCDLADETDVESSALVSVALTAASDAIWRLSEEEQELLVLKYFYGKSVPEAAAVVGMQPGTAAEHHGRAVHAVRSALLAVVSDADTGQQEPAASETASLFPGLPAPLPLPVEEPCPPAEVLESRLFRLGASPDEVDAIMELARQAFRTA